MKKILKPLIGITTDLRGKYLILKKCYANAISSAGGIPLLIPPDKNSLKYASYINGLLISGGNDLDPSYYNEFPIQHTKVVSKERSIFEIDLLNEVIRLGKPILGICYGMQLINVALGGTLYQDIKLQIPVEINHERGYHRIVVTENRFFKKGMFSVNSTHKQAVNRIGNSLTAFAYSIDNIIEAIYLEDYPFLIGVQWHPERLLNRRLSVNIFKSFVEASADNQ